MIHYKNNITKPSFFDVLIVVSSGRAGTHSQVTSIMICRDRELLTFDTVKVKNYMADIDDIKEAIEDFSGQQLRKENFKLPEAVLDEGTRGILKSIEADDSSRWETFRLIGNQWKII